MPPATLRPLMREARHFATRDVDNRIAAGTIPAREREHFIRNNTEALACSAHVRGVSVAEYVAAVAPELLDAAAGREMAA